MLAVVAGRALLGDDGGGDDGSAARAAADPLAYTPQREAGFVAAAARGNAHVLYAKSPGGARASAERTARCRPLVEAAAATAGIDADTLEGIVLLESAGRPDARRRPAARGRGRADADPRRDRARPARHAGRPAGRAADRALAAARAGRGDGALVARLRRAAGASTSASTRPRRSPRRRATCVIAKKALHRDDLAVVSYHMGIGNLQTALRDYGDDDVSYARLYFDSTPLRHAAAYRQLAALGDDSATYLWRVAAAREIMRLYRSDPAQLDRVSRAADREELRRGGPAPGRRDDAVRDAGAAARRLRRRARSSRCRGRAARRARPRDRPRDGRARRRASASRRTTYRGLRAPALALLAYLGAQVKRISGQHAARRDEQRARRALPARCCSTTQPRGDRELLAAHDRLDVRHPAQLRARARRRWRSSSCSSGCSRYDLIAWVREPAAIHVTVSAAAAKLSRVVR